jgi:hypothetical protein
MCLPLSGPDALAPADDDAGAAELELEPAAELDFELELPQPTAITALSNAMVISGITRDAFRTLPTVLSPHLLNLATPTVKLPSCFAASAAADGPNLCLLSSSQLAQRLDRLVALALIVCQLIKRYRDEQKGSICHIAIESVHVI